MLNWLKKWIPKRGSTDSRDQLPSFDAERLKGKLLTEFRYQELPELVGKSVLINGLTSLEEDLLANLKPDYPYLNSLWTTDKNWENGTDLVFFWKTPMFQINILTEGVDTLTRVTLEQLIEMNYLKYSDDLLCLDIDGDMEELGWTMFEECLDKEKENVYMHLFLHYSRNRNDHWDNKMYPPGVFDKIGVYFDSKDNTDRMQRTRAFSEYLGSYFYPRNMYIHNACLTNVPSSLVWCTKFWYC